MFDALPHPADADSGSNNCAEFVIWNSLPEIPDPYSYRIHFLDEIDARVLTFRMPIGVGERLLDNAEDDDFEIAGKAPEDYGLVVKGDAQLPAALQALEVPMQSGEQTGFVKQGGCRRYDRLRTLLRTLAASSRAWESWPLSSAGFVVHIEFELESNKFLAEIVMKVAEPSCAAPGPVHAAIRWRAFAVPVFASFDLPLRFERDWVTRLRSSLLSLIGALFQRAALGQVPGDLGESRASRRFRFLEQ